MALKLKEDFKGGEYILANYLNATNIKVNQDATKLDNLKTQCDQMQDEIAAIGEVGHEVAVASEITLASGTGLNAATAQQAFAELATEVFPLEVAIIASGSNGGKHEVTDSEHPVTPTFALSITRRGSDVSASATITVENHLTGSGSYSVISNATFSNDVLTCPTIINGMVYRITVTQGGQTVVLDGEDTSGAYANFLRFTFLNYVYGFPVATKPTSENIGTVIGSSTADDRVLSNATETEAIELAAEYYYVFAVKGSVNLVCRHAGTDGIVTGCTTGTVTLNRINGYGTDSYSYIIIEAADVNWSFKIKNS